MAETKLKSEWKIVKSLVAPLGPRLSDLSAKVERAKNGSGGIDLTDMSREERAKALFGN